MVVIHPSIFLRLCVPFLSGRAMALYNNVPSAGQVGSTRTLLGAKKHARSRNGCLTCRNRHIKCDEKHPHCGQCATTRRCRYSTEAGRRFPDTEFIFAILSIPTRDLLTLLKLWDLSRCKNRVERRPRDLIQSVMMSIRRMFDSTFFFTKNLSRLSIIF